MVVSSPMLTQLIDLLNKLDLDLIPQEIGDMLWLAAHLDAPTKPNTESIVEPEVIHQAPSNYHSSTVTAQSHSPSDLTTEFPLSATQPTIIKEPHAKLYSSRNKEEVIAGETQNIDFRSPGVPALPGTLELARALRPLKRAMLSRTQFIFDEKASIDAAANAGNPVPILRPAATRWLDVVLVVDDSSSMSIWRATIQELQRLLERQGAFRNVQLWSLQYNSENSDPRLQIGIDKRPNQRAHIASELIDPSGQRLILIVTDCVSPAWDRPYIAKLIKTWGTWGPVTLVQMLPKYLWDRTALSGIPEVHLSAHLPGLPNAQLQVKWRFEEYDFTLRNWLQSKENQMAGVVVPIITLEPRTIDNWAAVLATGNSAWISGFFFPTTPLPPPEDDFDDEIGLGAEQLEEQPSARTLVENFNKTASPIARKLARYLAAAPLTIPVMRLVQNVMLPDSLQVHLAEVFLSGLIERQMPEQPILNLDTVQYEFVDGVRDELLGLGRRSATLQVVNAVSEFIGQHLGQQVDFQAWFADPRTADKVIHDSQYSHFATVTANVLKRLGGKYGDLADQLKHHNLSNAPSFTTSQLLGEVAITLTVYPPQIAIEPFDSKVKTIDRQTLIRLRHFLSNLYDDLQTIHRLLDDADLDTARINLGGNATNIWHNVLDEVQKQAKLEQVLAVVLLDYPNKRSELGKLLNDGGSAQGSEFSSDRNQTSATPASTPAQQTQPAPTPAIPAPSSSSLMPPLPIETQRNVRLTAIDLRLLRLLFTKAAKLLVSTEFTDGRTATRVLLVRPVAEDGVTELPAVVKLGPRALIEMEWLATQHQVLDRLPGFAAVRSEPIYFDDENGGQWAALRYAQVGDGVFDVESLSRYATHASIQDLWHVLENRLFRQLGTLCQQTQQWVPISFQQRYDGILPVNLEVVIEPGVRGVPIFLDATYLATTTDELLSPPPDSLVCLDGFVVTECAADGRELTLDLPKVDATPAAYRLRVHRPENTPPLMVGERYPSTVGRVRATRQSLLQGYIQPHLGPQVELTAATVALPDGATLPNPLLALPTLLTRRHDGWLATIHGDLNLRNILIDPDARTTHIIDCAAARQDHVLHDLLRLECDLLTDLAAQNFFNANLPPTAIVRFYRTLHCACRGESHEPGRFALPSDLEPALEKLFITLATLRQAAHERLAVASGWAEYYTGLVIHLLGALKYRDLDQSAPGRQPKAIAFWVAATLVGLLQDLEKGDEGFCQAIQWRPFDIKGIKETVAGVLAESLTSSGPSRNVASTLSLESLPSKGATIPVDDDRSPVQRRLDVAVPTQATVQRPFLLAVAVRQNSSPPLLVSELPMQHNGTLQFDWPADEPFVWLRVQVVAPECTIVGEESYTFKLYHNLDSEVYYFSCIPGTTSQLTSFVRIYDEIGLSTSGQGQPSMKPTPVLEIERTFAQATNQPPLKILFLAANPLDTARLNTDEDVRAIDLALRQANYRRFAVASHYAVRIDDLQELLLRHRPDILHFSGYGAAINGIFLQDADGQIMPVPGATLGRLLRVLKDNLRCVVLNACYTADNAAGLAEVIDCVVGIEDTITDTAALQFAIAFYQALSYGRSVQEAFNLGRVQIGLAGLGGASALHLHENRPYAAQMRFMPKLQLTSKTKLQLVNALLACPSMDDRQTRNDIVNNLPDAIKGNIERSDAARVDVLNIVNTAANYANGLEDLITWVRFYEGDSLPMQAVDELLA